MPFKHSVFLNRNFQLSRCMAAAPEQQQTKERRWDAGH
jgi:hypothetical protein